MINTISAVQISLAQTLAILFSALVCVGLPILLLILWRKRTHAPMAAVVCGAVIFVVFALGLEQVSHLLVQPRNPDSFVGQHAWAYILYGVFAAGIFEETGRFVGFKFFLRKHNGRETSVMYGIGHGGIESILLVGSTIIVGTLVLASQYSGWTQMGGGVNDTVTAAARSLASISAGIFILTGLERVLAICLHIALSVLVFQAAKRPGKLWLYPAAILLHALGDLPAALYHRGILTNMYVMEILTAVIVAAMVVIAVGLYRQDGAQESPLPPMEAASIPQPMQGGGVEAPVEIEKNIETPPAEVPPEQKP